ncbi:MAG TPA: DUF4272 domain-containing protein [Actinomycetota bacterium]|nr:DUF4272 domain-containing protein [Actinomycetota bacterium]
MTPPEAAAISDRALVLYALVRRASIELVVRETGDDRRIEQAEKARAETDRWLDREDLVDALTAVERRLFAASSGAWPPEAIADGLWRKESLGVLLWSLEHLGALPPIDDEFEVSVLNQRIEAYGSESAFRANGRLRDAGEIERAWSEADAWLAATEGRTGDDATIASISAERLHALTWLRDAAAAPA